MDDDEDYWLDTMSQSQRRYVHEPYRRKLVIMEHRLTADLARLRARLHGEDVDLPEGYPDARAFLADLQLIRDSLISQGDSNAAEGGL
ncbi:phosphoenolpyruvate carboxylase [Thiorhodovibrio litoralis]|uniref:phosphoenolpyruvate carboxylase n=1 Tax=Thiorhodovibrio litoralis TaxID=2952932 RepID=UPI002B259F90|nr:phosphoenolpyruvate carboxylase [Thiorhodovibrio litoralis]